MADCTMFWNWEIFKKLCQPCPLMKEYKQYLDFGGNYVDVWLCRNFYITKSLSQPPGGTFHKLCDTIFVVCSQIFTLFWLIKTAVPVEISRYSIRVFSCAYPTVISSISGWSFHFPFPYFVINHIFFNNPVRSSFSNSGHIFGGKFQFPLIFGDIYAKLAPCCIVMQA